MINNITANMKLSQFKFRLENDRIAQYPTPFRDDCRRFFQIFRSAVVTESLPELHQFFFADGG